jgi:hypothetical protein
MIDWVCIILAQRLRGYSVLQLVLIGRPPRHIHTSKYENVSHSDRWREIITVIWSNKYQQNLKKIHNELKKEDRVFT